MIDLKPDQFPQFFCELWGYEPFPWQRRLAAQVCTGNWPDYLALPTASGKTACVDIAVFSLAFQADWSAERRTAPRRIQFVVDRRVVVTEAFERAERLAQELSSASRVKPVVQLVAERLRHLAGDAASPPLDCCQLRGGIYRDNAWVRSPTHPTVIISTVDQVGSRLLFRGYGVSATNWPIYAALAANDALLILDEAHCARPFSQTVQAIKRYRGKQWALAELPTPFGLTQMTATPPPDAEADGTLSVFRLDEEDAKPHWLGPRLFASKPTRLEVAKLARGDDASARLVAKLGDAALEMEKASAKAIAVIVNRVATAREVHRGLRDRLQREGRPAVVELVIGRMRPIDRDDLTERLKQLVGSRAERGQEATPVFVVATQCLEVGADYDFDAMVSECASIDALRQRFGRLNRMGRPITASGCIVIRTDQQRTEEQLDRLDREGRHADPIYGNALARTWNWLCNQAQVETSGRQQVRTIDMGIARPGSVGEKLDLLRRAGIADEEARKHFDRLHPPAPDAPVMLPSHVDCWCQTHPVPMPDPDVSVFLHGPQRGEPEVQLVWRADIAPLDDPQRQQQQWRQIVGLCPPTSAECLSVPISVVRRWLRGEAHVDAYLADVLGGELQEEADEARIAPERRPLAWRGPQRSEVLTAADQVRPGDTLILPVSSPDAESMGHFPNGTNDRAHDAFLTARDRLCLRLHPRLLADWPGDAGAKEPVSTLLAANGQSPDADSVRRALLEYVGRLASSSIPPPWPEKVTDKLRTLGRNKWKLAVYPGRGTVDEEPSAGLVFESRCRLGLCKTSSLEEDAGEDELCGTGRVSLEEHTTHVRQTVLNLAAHLLPEGWSEVFAAAADAHDLGKADPRFQAVLLGGDPLAARFTPNAGNILAKGERAANAAAYHRQCRRSGLPEGFRHELVSAQLAEALGVIPTDSVRRDLVLHLVSGHHGRCRPLAPLVIDDEPPELCLACPDLEAVGRWTTEDRRHWTPPHRLDSGIPERFWRLVRHFGWWGSAYLETILRLADWRASQEEEAGDVSGDPPHRAREAVS